MCGPARKPRSLRRGGKALTLVTVRLPQDGKKSNPPEVSVFVFVSHLTVPDADHAGLEQHFQQRSGLVDDFPGFLHLQLLRPQSGTATHTFVTTWTDAEAFRRYMKSPERAVAHSREPADIMARTTVRHEAYEVLMDSRSTAV